ncbi:uncharacterized protein HMPREF1541_03511 [Cyphellophora europaea CBS 101466]|uniref:Retrotransposon gag domain-containing protein n=1 Tax=Cyphellophora europaea (strain CBS 101466) TaxID=1220924 RepID=W2RZ15_CYPE1|nr:uncharacterized protein HMPREF1541_03511 [Cyphellophora europaea CBS 101466]ETN41575.1 hypothetical protein HMPREF1541_03511 [Cyphellophora europaea CBS 101466]
MAFDLNQGQFTSNRLKVIYTAAHLKGAAFAWFEPFLSDHYENTNGAKEKTKRLIDSFKEFKREMKVIFDWDEDEALWDMFYQGLKIEVKAKMAVPLPTTLIEVVDKAIKVDNRLYELRIE